MLKNHALRKILKSTVALFILLLLCIFPKENTDSFSQEVIYIDELTIPIYTIDKHNYVARTNVAKRNNNDDIKYIIDLLTIDSLTSITLPDGFISIIPKNTKLISYDLKEGLLKLNFSEEFLNISQDNSRKMIESIVYSLCELDNVDKIMIFIENEKLNTLPNSNITIPLTLDKSFGVNVVFNLIDIKNTTKATIYYIGKNQDSYYYIPITKITNNDTEAVEVIVNELKTTPIYETNLISYLNASYELKDYQILENAIELSFNNQLIANLDEKDIEEKVKYTLALSLRDTYNIEDITININ